jgi:poly(hydroxyalkanoate) depolymerase family esterase
VTVWQEYHYSEPAGTRPYWVYTPPHYHAGIPAPLLVMLHGCRQTPADFAAGTQMNHLAEQYHFLVLYPQQTSVHNRNRCWNWFVPAHQAREQGEPSLIAGMVQTMRQQSSRWAIDPARIYVAGFSAGASMAVILGVTYPDLFAAIGIHSGVAYQSADDLYSALQAMRQGGPDPIRQGQWASAAMGRLARVVPTIVFQGRR